MTDADQQRVVGWLAITLQRRNAPLLAADRVQYTVNPTGTVVVAWRSGPTASAVAELLLAAANPDMPVVELRRATESLRAQVRVGGIEVLLQSHQPDPTRAPGPPSQPAPAWSWPAPLRDTGAALHTVHWTLPPDDGIGIAVVGALPPHLQADPSWREPGVLVAHDDHEPPDHADDDHRRAVERYRRQASIRLRLAAVDDPLDAADQWLIDQQSTEFGTPVIAAVCWPGTCLMRMSTRLVGLRIHARLGSAYASGPTTLVPAAVLNAITRDPTGRVPTQLSVRHYGNTGSERTFSCDTDLAAPQAR